jgi:hypothetical protein
VGVLAPRTAAPSTSPSAAIAGAGNVTHPRSKRLTSNVERPRLLRVVIGRERCPRRKVPTVPAFRAFVCSTDGDGIAAISRDFGHTFMYHHPRERLNRQEGLTANPRP